MGRKKREVRNRRLLHLLKENLAVENEHVGKTMMEIKINLNFYFSSFTNNFLILC